MSENTGYKPFQYEDELKGIFMMLAASMFFATMGFFIKKLTPHHVPIEIIFYRNIVSLFFIIGSLIIFPPVQQGGRPVLLVMRGVYGFIAMFFYFYSVSVLPLATAATFSKTSPLFTAVIAGFMMKEKAGGRVWTAVFLGFIGVILILQPGGNTNVTGSLSGVASGFFAALAYATVRGLSGYYDARVIVFFFSLAGLTGSGLYMTGAYFAGVDRYVSFAFIPHGIDYFYIFMVGLLAAVAQFLMSRSYFYGRAAVISTVSYSELIFSTFAGYMAGDALPDMISFAGILLVGVSGILIVRARKR